MSVLETLYAADAGRPRKHLFDGDYREAVGECVQRTVANMLAIATRYDHWILAYSGGKDSSTVLTVIFALGSAMFLIGNLILVARAMR
jgi:DNA sulfur modification protein DndC